MENLASDSVELCAVGGASAQGFRPSQQDRYSIVISEEMPSGISDTLAMFGVFDGHGSHFAAQHAKNNIPRFLLNSPEFRKGEYQRAMQEAIEKEDRTLLKGFRNGEDRFANSGSTVAISLVNLTKGILIVGNLGDSHISMVERDPDTTELQNVDRLTESHKPESPEEKRRIEDAGGKVHFQHNVWRIGALNLSRAIGDLKYKRPLNNITTDPVTDAQRNTTEKPTEDRDDFVSIKMSFRQVELQKDKQYILALTTDGVTNIIDDKTLMHNVMHLFNLGKNAEEVSQSLVDDATTRPGSDNATCIAVFLNGISAPPFDRCHWNGC
ncbi:phosphatase 2C-like domain-containing protein [Aspergillus cavernicola]|uniref:protein-serine/threonine phosphatase n=1 Tax=Aspergillus cavernicola TaxID=176166 RepID=A0ABR4J0K8_9EURO